MGDAILILVNGEVLASGDGPTISDQRRNAQIFAEYLLPLLRSEQKIAIMHGNKPQVGFVLFRSELASHVLHTIPLDVCGADTQGATGYILSLELMNALTRAGLSRKVMCVLTQTLVDSSRPKSELPVSAIGPWYDRHKAEQFRQARGWQMVEEVGKGYRRGVPAYPAKEILEIDIIRRHVNEGDIVIAGGGGGIPVQRDEQGELRGIEAVIETEQLACLMARQIGANVLLSVIENDHKFILSGIGTERLTSLSAGELSRILGQDNLPSRSVSRILRSAYDFIKTGGDQVIITTLKNLPRTLERKSGLVIGHDVLVHT